MICAMQLLLLSLSSVLAQEPLKADSTAEKPAVAPLKVGDAAPALSVTHWLQGEPVKSLEKGKIYVIEFWAPACAAPARYMPHLAALQARYKDQGVIVISFTSRGIHGFRDNTEDKVATFLKRRGPSQGYRFAYANDTTTADAWMKGQRYFCTFVVDRSGRIAYIGGPMFVGMVLPKVVAGGASAKAIGNEMAKVVADYQAVVETINRDAKAGLNSVAEFEAGYPLLADFLPVVYHKLTQLVKNSNNVEAKTCAEKLVTKAISENNVFVLELVYWALRDQKGQKELLSLAQKAAEAQVRIDGGAEAESLLHLADAYLQNGDKLKAKEYTRKALDAAEEDSSQYRLELEKQARRLGLSR
jgi:thiol-disulfide isomerase/thioredoxin